MTKKSAARLERDNYLKNNTAWSDIEQLYHANNALLASVSAQVSKFFSIEGVASFLPADHRTSTVTAIRTLDSDVKVFKEDLDKIFASHSHKKGALKPTEDIHDVIRISEAYAVMEIQINSVITPVYHYLLSIMEQVTVKAAAQAEAEKATAPTPVTA